MKDNIKTITFGAGCFWGVQHEFDMLEGVIETTVGYMGGHTKNPTYEEVCTDKTGHAEVVEVKFDQDKISVVELIEKFWKLHDPTTKDSQGPDVGSQYRSAIFYYDNEQKEEAEKSKNNHQKEFNNNIVTEITNATEFTRAEEYHQKYFEKTGKKVCH